MIGTVSGPILIVGAGGFGREVLDVIEAINAAGGDLRFVGFADDGQPDLELLARRDAPFLGPTAAVSGADAMYVIGIGSGSVRQRIAAQLDSAGCQPATLVHPAATVGGDSRVAPGCILTAGSRVTTNVTLEEHVQLHVNSTVGHDSTLRKFTSVYPGATIGGNVTLRTCVTVGTGANVLPGLCIADQSFVGAGAVVTTDVDVETTVAGVPARPLRARPMSASAPRRSAL